MAGQIRQCSQPAYVQRSEGVAVAGQCRQRAVQVTAGIAWVDENRLTPSPASGLAPGDVIASHPRPVHIRCCIPPLHRDVAGSGTGSAEYGGRTLGADERGEGVASGCLEPRQRAQESGIHRAHGNDALVVII